MHWLLISMSSSSADVITGQDKSFEGLRDSVVWLRSQGNETIQLQWQDWYAGDSTINYIYIQSPQGTLLDKIKINYGNKSGKKTYQLPPQSGDYRIEFPGYFFRKGSIRVDEKIPMVLEPAKGHVSLHANKKPLFFSVPKHSKQLALCGRYSKGPSSIKLFRPDNHLHQELVLKKNPSTLHFDCLKLKNPVAGIWRIEFNKKGKVAFWLDGVGNYFALNPDVLFIPVLEPGKVTISNSEINLQPMGEIGSHAVNINSDPRILDALHYMRLKSFNRYVDHYWREPFNPDFPNSGDNNDPSIINVEGFQWDDQRLEFYAQDLDASLSIIFDSRNSWLGMPITADKRMEYAEFVFAYINHANKIKDHDIRWISLWDEPNLEKFSFEQYESLLKTVASRLKSPSNSEKVLNTSLLAVSSAGFDTIVTGKKYLGMNWAKKIYATNDSLVDGIAFDYWNIRDLIELWRYDNAVSIAHDIIVENDSDNDINEAIIINQTSMSSGSSSSAYDVNSHFGALWLAGAICNAFKSGHLDAFYYFPTLDDQHHMKGLMYANELPPRLPFSDSTSEYGLKPIAYSMSLINRHILDQVLVSNTDSLEVDALITIDSGQKSITILVVNKFPRTSDISIQLHLPKAMREKTYLMKTERFGTEESRPMIINNDQLHSVATQLLLNKKLEGESIYIITLKTEE